MPNCPAASVITAWHASAHTVKVYTKVDSGILRRKPDRKKWTEVAHVEPGVMLERNVSGSGESRVLIGP